MFFNFSFPQKCGLCTTPRATCLGGCRAGRKHGTSAPVSSPAKPCTGMRMQRPWDAAAWLLPECPALKSPLVNDGDSEAHRKFQNLIAEPVTSAPTSPDALSLADGVAKHPAGLHACSKKGKLGRACPSSRRGTIVRDHGLCMRGSLPGHPRDPDQ